MFKKTLAILLLSLFLLTACGESREEKEASEKESSGSGSTLEKTDLYHGLGFSKNFRIGPGTDEEDNPVYSFNIVAASAIFDGEGKILDLYVDVIEVSTPNYDGESMPHFSGWPGTEGIPAVDHNTEELQEAEEVTEDLAEDEVKEWWTKRDRSDAYGMNPAMEWYEQMDAYQDYFKGMTANEINGWFNAYTGQNGRPLQEDSVDEEDAAKYEHLTTEEKEMLADVTAGATMSLNDAHGNIVEAIVNAYESRVPVE